MPKPIFLSSCSINSEISLHNILKLLHIKNENDLNRKKCQMKTTQMILWWSFYPYWRKMNLKKSEGTVLELSACFRNVMQNLALPLAFHTLSATLATLRLKDETEKKKKRRPFPPRLIKSSQIIQPDLQIVQMDVEPLMGACWFTLENSCSSVMLKHRPSQCPTLLCCHFCGLLLGECVGLFIDSSKLEFKSLLRRPPEVYWFMNYRISNRRMTLCYKSSHSLVGQNLCSGVINNVKIISIHRF